MDRLSEELWAAKILRGIDRGGGDAMNERLSAWIDGELESKRGSQLPSQLKHDAALRATWDCYHLIGDAVRGMQGSDLCARIFARLDAEPTVLAPRSRMPSELIGRFISAPAARGAAVVFAVLVGWATLPTLRQDLMVTAQVPIPSIEALSAVPVSQGVADYLLAHQRFSSINAIHGLASYVRTLADHRAAPVSIR